METTNVKNDMEQFEYGVRETLEFCDKLVEGATEDGDDYNTFYRLLGSINTLLLILGDDLPLTEVCRQVLEETKLLLESEEQ